MRTDLERQLRDALHEDARRARLAHPDGPPAPEARSLPQGEAARWSARRLVAVAAAIVLIAAAATAVMNRGPESGVDTISPPDTEEQEDVSPDTTLDPAQLFAGFPAGAAVELPPAPVSERAVPAVVWSGTEVIVWGGMDAAGSTLADGAAFDPATGAWRVIAPASVDARIGAEAAWTGTEMVIWGGSSTGGGPLKDGAAYDPATDTWRPLAEGPFDGWDSGAGSVWTGDELIVIGLEPDPPAGERKPMAAYDPETDEWRQLADVPQGTDFDLVWTGDALLTTVTGYSTSTGEGTSTDVWTYDPGRDRWESAAGLESVDVSLLPVMEVDGSVRAVLAVGHETGAPITVLDRTGNATGTLPAIPGDAATLGEMSASGGVWLGEEGVFWIRPLEGEGTPEHWALSWSTRTWRPLEDDEVPPMYFELTPVPGAGVLIGFSVTSEDNGVSTGIVYRPPSPPED